MSRKISRNFSTKTSLESNQPSSTCTENVLRESKFVKSLAASTTLVDGRIQVKMPWKEGGPPTRSHYDIALKRMFSAERGFLKKGCFEVVKEEA